MLQSCIIAATTELTITPTTAMSSNSISIVQTILDNETTILDSTETYNGEHIIYKTLHLLPVSSMICIII